MLRTLLTSTIVLAAAAPAIAEPPTVALEFRGVIELPQNLVVDGQTFGGISGVAYDPQAKLFYGVGDDLKNARFHTIAIDLADGTLDEGDVEVKSSVLIKDIDQQPFPDGSVDPEGLVILDNGDLLIAAEPVGDTFPAFIRRYKADGTFVAALPLDAARYDPRLKEGRGARNSGGFESLVLTDDKATLYAAFEKPLGQDAAAYDPKTESTARILVLDPGTGAKQAEYVYTVGTMTIAPQPADGGYGRGLNDLLVLEPGRFLSVERQYAQGVTGGAGSRPVEIFEVSTDGASDVKDVDALTGDETPVAKTLVLDLDTLRGQKGVERIGSHEVLAFGPELPDGARSLVMIEDNDFDRPTQILLFALTAK